MKRVKLFLPGFSFFLPLTTKSSHSPFSSISSLNFPLPLLSSTRDDPSSSFATALSFASKTKSYFLGNQIHTQIIKLGFLDDIFSRNNLIVTYSKCGVLGSALKVFDEMNERNLVSWTAMVSGAVANGELELGIGIYLKMVRLFFCPNEFALGSVLRACMGLEAFMFGKSLHSFALKICMDVNKYVGGSLLYMYAKCGDVESAEEVFECISYKDIGCWNTMVEGYVLNNLRQDAIGAVSFMIWSGLIADEFTFASVLKGCLGLDDLKYGKQIHALVVRTELEYSTLVMNSMAAMYHRAGMRHSVMKVFGRTRQKDIISWNTMMAAFAQEGYRKEFVNLFTKMMLEGFKPSQVSLSTVSRLCGAQTDLELGVQFFCLAFHLGFLKDTLVVNSFINMFAKCGEVEQASLLFRNHTSRNIVTWNEMIVGYNLNGQAMEALQVFFDLRKLGFAADIFTYSSALEACCGIQYSNMGEQLHTCAIKCGFDCCSFVGSSLINFYAKFRSVEDSFKTFKGINMPDLVSWGSMISAFSKQGFSQESLLLLNHLRERGEKPDEFILSSALNSCANISAFIQNKCIHSHVIKAGFEDHMSVTSALIDAYSKCGDIDSSKKIFSNLSIDDDPIIFNTMITAFAHHGLIVDALKLFKEMKQANIEPTQATFGAVLSACSHYGLVEEGQSFFDSIHTDHRMLPSESNYACLVDLHSRSGSLEKAREVIEYMPFEPWPAIWRSLLNGCRIHGNQEMGELAAEKILKLVPNNDAANILLSKVYAEKGSWEDVAELRRRMSERELGKVPGYSWLGI